MDKPINGDKYVRTLSHYLRHNQRRLVPTEAAPTSNNSSPRSNGAARSLVTPSDPMAAAYSGMVNSLWSMGSAVVDAITPSGSDPPPPASLARDRDSYTGAWDGTGSIVPSAANPREQQLYLQAQLKAPIFPLDLYYLLYLLERFEQEGIEIDGWDGATPRAVGDSKPRVLNNGMPNSTTYSSFPPPTATRPQSIRSFSSTALSTLTLITGWKQWSNAASSTSNSMTIADDINFIHQFLKKITGLRLVAKIPPGLTAPAGTPGGDRGRIEGYSGDAILTLFNAGQSHELPSSSPSSTTQVLLPMAATFSSLTHLELHKIPPKSIEGWESLMAQLKSLVIIQAGIEDVYDVMVAAVVESERRRRQRVQKEKTRAVLLRQEQRDALRDANRGGQGRRAGSGSGSGSSGTSSGESSNPSSPALSTTGGGALGEGDFALDDQSILNTTKMWPRLRHLSVSDNALPALQNQDTFSYTQAMVSLDLSHNLLIAAPPGLIHLHNLHHLNLSYNMISNVQAIYQILGNIAVLDLRGNRLESLCGLERLWNLEKIDVRDNHLDEAAEVGRLAALPGIREVWSEKNPFCTIQPKHRLEILAVFKANGHDLLLDGTFASFTEKRSLTNMSPTSFSTTIASINNVNLANIPAASAPTATLAKELLDSPPRITRPTSTLYGNNTISSLNATDAHSATSPPSLVAAATSQQRPIATKSNSSPNGKSGKDAGLTAMSPPGTNPSSPPAKLVKKKLVRSSKRVQRVVNLDSDHDHSGDEDGHLHDDHEVLGAPVVLEKKKKKTIKKKAVDGEAAGEEGGEKKTKKKVVKKKKSQGLVSFAGDQSNGIQDMTAINGQDNHNGDDDDGIDHSECKGNNHVHRLAQLEQSMASNRISQPSRGILKKSPSVASHHHHHDTSSSPPDHSYLRPTSPTGSYSSLSDDGGAEAYRRKIEAMRNEAGSNWLKVLAEMDSETALRKDSEANTSSGNNHHQ
ncbi:hypothetical protein BGX30_013184 [Mortierella sp. GBA39]|nr:hypothetical protein BGX30_013184 [Mortierella sp. GBA39]